jgi:UDP-N-acetylglucosamine 2-epimerase (non-hydrolysing)/GDP/UDP-N,N'-diacetylbacillosamine 2-epimerase (hydrolysing)
MLVLGDRFETLAAATAALVARIPIAHIGGGDVTEGAMDDSIRHAITKMAHLHFVTNEPAARRVRQLGEEPSRVHNVGSPGIDYLRKVKLLDRSELEASLGFKLRLRNVLVTFHPPTVDPGEAPRQIEELLAALSELGPQFGILVTYPNADNESRVLIKAIERFVSEHPNARAFASLGQQRYLSAMAAVDVLVGNSSSALYEAPTLRKPAVNIGDRQKGRLKAASVLDCEPQRDAIRRTIQAALALDCSRVVNPYGDGRSAERIAAILDEIHDPKALLRKRFVDIEWAC